LNCRNKFEIWISKYLYLKQHLLPTILKNMCFATCCPEGWVEGGTKVNDYHVWVEDEEGNIYDPEFQDHIVICKMWNANINKPIYRPWGNQEYWFNYIYPKDFRKIMTKKEMKSVNKNVKHIYLMCPNNSIKNYCKLKLMGKNPRVVIGSMGWERDNGTAHWEWG
jgi:hypothetical protein